MKTFPVSREALDKEGLQNNTVIAMTSENGEEIIGFACTVCSQGWLLNEKVRHSEDCPSTDE